MMGCVSPPPEVVKSDSIPVLANDVGILVLHVDTNAPLSGLEANGRSISGELAKGRHLWLVRLPAGRYAWTEIAFAPSPNPNDVPSWCRRARPARFDPLTDLKGTRRSEFEFDVATGAVNYPGELILRADYGYCGWVAKVTIRNRNHSAMALESLLKQYPALLDSLPVRYAGSSSDEFLQYFARERARIAKDVPSEEAQ